MPSHCNPVGYWKIKERNICLTYDAAGDFLIPRRCKGGTEQSWAKNGAHICHPVKDKCFTPSVIPTKNIWLIQLIRNSVHDKAQKWRWNNEDTTQLESFNNLCIDDTDNYFGNSSFTELLKCDKNKKTQKWSFMPIIHPNNSYECANFSERPPKRL